MNLRTRVKFYRVSSEPSASADGSNDIATQEEYFLERWAELITPATQREIARGLITQTSYSYQLRFRSDGMNEVTLKDRVRFRTRLGEHHCDIVDIAIENDGQGIVVISVSEVKRNA